METAIYIFTGHYGSGKTETAVNFARMLRKDPARKIALIDLDIVNPFFRSADAKAMMEEIGVRLETPVFANTNVDIPALTGVMGALMEDPSYDVILDVGGDDLGAKAVGRYADTIQKRKHFRYFVMNERRPFTRNAEAAALIYDEIDKAACVPCSGIINNTNLLDETTPETILGGIPEVEALCKAKGVPLCYHVVEESLIPTVLEAGQGKITQENIIPLVRTVQRLF